MQKYQKIENIINYDGKGNLPVDFTEKYKTLKDIQVFGTEKVDGTNIGIVWDGYRISLQGRTEKSQLPKHLEQKLTEMFLTEEMENVFEQVFGEKEAIVFGEGYGEKIQQGGGNYFSLTGDRVGFIAFDVVIDGYYLSRENVEDVCNKLNIPVVPVVYRGTLKGALHYVLNNRESKVALSNNAKNDIEGIVCQPNIQLFDSRGNRIIFKVKYRDMIKLVSLPWATDDIKVN